MTYAEIKRAVLEIINQYSIAGAEIPLSYNNQSDDIHRIPNLINQGLMDIRTSAKPKRAVHQWKQYGDGWGQHRLPREFWRMRSGSLRLLSKNGPPEPTNDYRLIGDKTIWTPLGEYLLEYDSYPEQLPENPLDTYELNEDPEVLQAAIYYVAAGLELDQDEFLHQSLYQEYENRKAAMRPAVTAEFVPIASVLDGLWDGC